jgi:hypothetical protein
MDSKHSLLWAIFAESFLSLNQIPYVLQFRSEKKANRQNILEIENLSFAPNISFPEMHPVVTQTAMLADVSNFDEWLAITMKWKKGKVRGSNHYFVSNYLFILSPTAI